MDASQCLHAWQGREDEKISGKEKREHERALHNECVPDTNILHRRSGPVFIKLLTVGVLSANQVYMI